MAIPYIKNNSVQKWMIMEIKFNSEPILLLPSGGLFIHSKSCLVVSDLHLGKGTLLQDNGVPIIDQIDTTTVQKLLIDLDTLKPDKCIICGDLVHAKTKHLKNQLIWFEKKLKQTKTTFIVTIGNHDIKELPTLLPKFKFTPEYKINSIYCSHYENSEKISISGHIHPGIKIRKGRITKYFKAFAISTHNITLPSYGEHTGSYTKLEKKKTYYYIDKKDIKILQKN